MFYAQSTGAVTSGRLKKKKREEKKREEKSLDRMYFQCPNEKDEVMSCAQCAPRLIMVRRVKVMTRKS